MEIAEIIQEAVCEERGSEVAIKLVENTRPDEPMVQNFNVDTSASNEHINQKVRSFISEMIYMLISMDE
jgi:hypothetical protein